MKYFLLASLILLLSCSKIEKKEQPFDSFVYSYSSMNTDYSIKLTDNDTVFFQKRYPDPVSNYYAILKDAERNDILRLIATLDFSKYDSLYIDPTLSDGQQLKFYKEKEGITQSVYVGDMDGPKDLFKLATHFNEFAKKINFKPYAGKVEFGNLENIKLPTPPPITKGE